MLPLHLEVGQGTWNVLAHVKFDRREIQFLQIKAKSCKLQHVQIFSHVTNNRLSFMLKISQTNDKCLIFSEFDIQKREKNTALGALF